MSGPSGTSATGGSSNRKNHNRNRNYHAKRTFTNSGVSSARQEPVARPQQSSRPPQLTREERAQNLQYRNVNMQKYEQMIGSAKNNFADIRQTDGPVEECTICCKTNDICGLGSCRHPICIECAIRMRVLSNSNQCPVCRTTMETLFLAFVSVGMESVPLCFSSLNHPDESRFGIRFQNPDVVKRYEKYLAHVCKHCRSPDGERLEFPTFVALRHHMSSVHELTYCHICTENIILFSRERKTYPRDALQRHIRNGDRDDKSLKGHPSCLFCDQRFFDEEFRYRHLRKDHFFCQFCESEGKHMNVFFEGHAQLLDHYKEKHFLCDYDECRAMGIAFSNQMDLNLHKSKEHSGRRAPVALDFQYNDRQLAGPSRLRRDAPATAAPQNPPPIRRDKVAVVQQDQPQPSRRPADEFVVVPSAQRSSRTARYNFTPAFIPQRQDFPDLPNAPRNPPQNILRPDSFPRLNRVNHPGGTQGGTSKSAQPNSSGPSLSASNSSSRLQQKTSPQPPDQQQIVEDFPALPSTRKQVPAPTVWTNKKHTSSAIVGCKVPSTNKELPQPDAWPDRSLAPPAKEVEPGAWHKVPAKPKKLDKKVRQGKLRVPLSSTSDVSENVQETAESNSMKAAADGSENKHAVVSSDTPEVAACAVPETKLKKEDVTVDSFSVQQKNSKVSKCEMKSVEAFEDNAAVEDRLAEVEKYVEECTKSAPVAEANKSSIFDWTYNRDSQQLIKSPFSVFALEMEPLEKEKEMNGYDGPKRAPGSEVRRAAAKQSPPSGIPTDTAMKIISTSTLFPNLSLANVMGTKEPSRDSESVPFPPPESSDKFHSEVLNDCSMYTRPCEVVPSGFAVGPSFSNDLLSGPPPGFESPCLSGLPPPPGLCPPSSSRQLFTMAPFISQSDINKNSVSSQKVGLEEKEWLRIRGKQ